MKKLKKLVSTISALALTFVLAACSVGNKVAQPTESSTVSVAENNTTQPSWRRLIQLKQLRSNWV